MQTTLLLGAHCSIAGGYYNAISIAHKLNTNCLQMFVKNQRQWHIPDITEQQLVLWRQTKSKFKNEILHIIAHSSYLINLASNDSNIRKRSINSLKEEIMRAHLLGITRYVLHPGNHKGQGIKTGIKLVTEGLNEVLSEFDDLTILLETTAGAGTSIGGTTEQLAEIINNSKFPEKLAICLDTCHLFVSGHDLSSKEKFDKFLHNFNNLIGLQKIACIHINDSAGKFNSHLDRHWHIGEGYMNINTFRYIINSKVFSDVPKIIETPKSADVITNDSKNLKTLKQLWTNGVK